jgi:hypothetical protein
VTVHVLMQARNVRDDLELRLGHGPPCAGIDRPTL